MNSKFQNAALSTALALIGVGLFFLLWLALNRFAPDLPTPTSTWQGARIYIVEPFAYRGEQDQGLLSLTSKSLILVAKGYFIALLIGAPIGFCLGLSKNFTRTFDPIVQVLRPVSPLAWFPLGMVLFLGTGGQALEYGALFTIAVCAMWPTVLNTAVGVRAIPQDYLNVGRVLRLSKTKMLFKIMVPATLPYMFTGFRLSLGIAWLVIVAVEMLTGKVGIGQFIQDAYMNANYGNIIVGILTIGIVGYILDRLMSVVEARFKTA
ncbi:MAG: nitrate ABC transporter permease [Verrucomicrobia bacterium]|nr:nitrate ABC transporter permease [Verrucomicrobiota bacterium]